MQGKVATHLRDARRQTLRLALFGLLALSLTGCASFWDKVSSRNFTFASLYTSKEPMVVLRDSKDGSERGQALAALREPLQHGGTQQDQEAYVTILTAAAISDRDPYCRLNAISALGSFKDARAAEALKTVHERPLTYSAELNVVIRQETLKSLAATGGPTARQVLVQVAKEPPTTGSERDVQETLDRRLTAVRGLANFKDGEAAEALYYVLSHDKDQAIKKRAHESLVKVTGRSLPPDVRTWDQALHPGAQGNTVVAQEPQRKWWNWLSGN